MKSKWRIVSARVIREVVSANPGVGEKELRKLVSAAYPFGERAMHPYEMWLDEVAKLFGDLRKDRRSREQRAEYARLMGMQDGLGL